ncbi:PLP-dependent aminotransferase family protein [Aureimonas altamirensis]|uniref:aminotransferase-like domain-containing protein n=1 Tax=Aureimonas altamirensis TaxID=370622 RepID=UPI001E5D31B8|nr:PLP-dependent aminotransferase family protein [Aureimonas altamirensis]UHD47953.1 PLP-dependent aminotransferase family protein [Aureimonas altamirensis]
MAGRARNLRIHDLGYRAETGLLELRVAILEHVTRARAVLADPEQVVVMPSAAAIVSLLARLPIDRGDRPVWMEDPGYVLVRDILRGAGKTIVPVPCDGEGMMVRSGEGPAPCFVYATPSHQYPTGVAMSLQRRLELLEFATSHGSTVIEDDYDSEFHYASRPLPALQGIDRSNCVAYTGTFSKTLAPGLRVAYAILPWSVLEQARVVLRREGGAVPVHVQAALVDFLNEGHLRAHVRRMRGIYQERMMSLRDVLKEAGKGWFALGSGAGGLQIPIWFDDRETDDRAIAQSLHEKGIGAMALSAFHLGAPRPGLLFGIGSVTPERLDRLMHELEKLRRSNDRFRGSRSGE